MAKANRGQIIHGLKAVAIIKLPIHYSFVIDRIATAFRPWIKGFSQKNHKIFAGFDDINEAETSLMKLKQHLTSRETS